MANDGSVLSKVEEWAVGLIQAANPAKEQSKRLSLVQLFPGTLAPSGVPQFQEMASPQTPLVSVVAWGMRGGRETSSAADWTSTLHCFLASKAAGLDAKARVGAEDWLGIHGATELIIGALDRIDPNQANDADTRIADSCELENVVGLGQVQGLFVVDVQFEIKIVRK